MTQTLALSALQATLAQAAALNGYFKVEVGTPTGSDWFTPAAFLDDPATLGLLWSRTSQGAKTSDRPYLKQAVFGSYIWMLTVSGLATYLLARRVPDLSAGNAVLHVNHEGWIDALALREARFACLPDDPASGDPQAVVVPDLEALRRYYLRALLDENLVPFMDTLKARFKYGLGAMRETVADRIVGTLIWFVKEHEGGERVHEEVEAFLGLLPYTTKSGVLEVPFEDRCELFLKRASCCMSYRLPQYGYCTSCPLQPEEERVRRFQAYLANPED
jgi:ferric iron reductase protein FhuF